MINLIKDMASDWEGRIILLMVALTVAILILAIYGSVLEAREWAAFKVEHDCKIVSRMKGETRTGVGYGMTTNSQFGTVVTTSSTPDKTGWLCDDGVTYWR